MNHQDLERASAAWDVSSETLDDVNLRIHDGAPVDALVARADAIASTIFSLVGDDVEYSSFLEIGSGVGFIMEAVERRTRGYKHRKEIVGLDISETMIEKARGRLSSNPNLANGLFRFASYDGVNIPFDDGQFDFVYSVATIQHIPKPYVYNLLFEIKRILKDRGIAVLQFLPFSLLPQQEESWSWRNEIRQQIGLIKSVHWHHYYTSEELHFVLRHGNNFPYVQIKENNNLWVCVSKTLQYPSLGSSIPTKQGM